VFVIDNLLRLLNATARLVTGIHQCRHSYDPINQNQQTVALFIGSPGPWPPIGGFDLRPHIGSRTVARRGFRQLVDAR